MKDILLREENIDQEKKHFWMIGLNYRNKILYIEMVSMGSVSETTVEPMNVFRVAVMKGAINVIMAHNHPSGDLLPSGADKGLTDRLIQVGRILHITVIEHMIISTESYFSFKGTGLLEKIGESTEWVPLYVLVEQIKKEEKKIREQAMRVAEKNEIKKGKVEIAKTMNKKGYPIDEIKELTGLLKTVINKLEIK